MSLRISVTAILQAESMYQITFMKKVLGSKSNNVINAQCQTKLIRNRSSFRGELDAEKTQWTRTHIDRLLQFPLRCVYLVRMSIILSHTPLKSLTE